ncbi:MAG: nucleotidyltransferase [Bacteroidetes bacterium HGW-Bacteroidetes-21]|jgi:glucose-1-phosphate thymidylyltransferase|nr:MAG: nucleotidyltransferase [Bacteroidetes bacterium HGW-Bacteroidetes-21]
MKLIIPMAGVGKRLRPHTLTTPKPLLPIAGKPIVQRLVEDITKVIGKPFDEIAFIIGHFGKEVEEQLCSIAKDMGSVPRIYYQSEALGTAHAVLCAAPSLDGPVVVAFADTLFMAKDMPFNASDDAVIWVQQVDNPEAFGVVKLDKSGFISDFIEKPKTFVSDLAIIGIYYVRDGKNFKDELQYLVNKSKKVNGEYQLTDVLENMKGKGIRFKTGKVDEWLDCGNKDATIYTNRRILESLNPKSLVDKSSKLVNSIVIPPCYVGENVMIENSVVGPYVSVGNDTQIKNSIIRNSILQTHALVSVAHIENSMIGNHAEIIGTASEVNVGDFNVLVK